jgi:alkylhydroperoxidase/carboxymuconolactone decarboxylase family protein YurZ
MNAKRPREVCLATVSLLYAAGKRKEAARFLKDAVRWKGIHRAFLEELFMHLSLLLGVPSMLDGLELLREMPDLRGTSSSSKAGGGKRILRRVYGEQTDRLIENLRLLHRELPDWIIHDVYGKVFGRKGLTLRERELCNVIVLGYQGLHRQLKSHVRGVLRTGMPPSELRTVLRITAVNAARFRVPGKKWVREVVSHMKKQ